MRTVHACIFSGLALSASLLMVSPARAAEITIINNTNFGGFNFTNFNGPNAGTAAAAGTNMNGISNTGTAVGFDIDNNGNLANFTTNPLISTNANVLNDHWYDNRHGVRGQLRRYGGRHRRQWQCIHLGRRHA